MKLKSKLIELNNFDMTRGRMYILTCISVDLVFLYIFYDLISAFIVSLMLIVVTLAAIIVVKDARLMVTIKDIGNDNH